MRSKHLLIVAGASLYALAAGSAAAQTAAPQAATPQPSTSTAAPAAAPDAVPQADAGAGVGDIVVTARRTSERLQDVPVAVTALTSGQLKDLSVRDVLEVQKMVPGLNISSQGTSGRAKFAIRGQTEADSRINTDGSVGVYIDGVNMPRNYGIRSAFIDIAQVEVLKGPQGTLYGKNTTGGALNITTQKPTFTTGGYADLLYGNYNHVEALGVLNLPIINDTLAIRAVLQSVRRDGFGHDAAGNPIADDHVDSGRLHILFTPSADISLLVTGDFVHQRNNAIDYLPSADLFLTNGNGATRALGEVATELGLNPNSAADRLIAYASLKTQIDAFLSGRKVFDTFGTTRAPDNLDMHGLSATLDWSLGGGVNFKSISSYRWLHENRFTASPFSFNILTAPSSSRDKNFAQELQLYSVDGKGLDWQVGVFANRETGNEFQANNTNPLVSLSNIAAVADGDITNASVAGYAQLTYNFSPKFRFTGGLRYTHDYRAIDNHNRIDPSYASVPVPSNIPGKCTLLVPAAGGPVFPDCSYKASTTFNAVTYLASFDYRPNSNLMFYALTSKGYRAGGYTSQAPAAPVPTQSALNAFFTPFKPETVFNYEAGIKSEWFDRRLRVNVAGYYQDYRDIQQQIRDTVNGNVINVIRNAAKGTVYGGELEIATTPVTGLDLNGGVSWVHARYNEFRAVDSVGNPLDLTARPFPVPEWTFNTGATYTTPLPNGSLRFTVNYAWQSNQVFRPDAVNVASVSQPAYGLLDGRISWRIESANLEISVWGKNLTNKRYAISATNLESIGFNVIFPGSPRLYGIQLRKTF